MSNACVTIDCKDWISTVTIDNPPDNKLDREVLSQLNRTVSEVYAEQSQLRVVLLTAKGRNFSTGIDYTEVRQDDQGRGSACCRGGSQSAQAYRKPAGPGDRRGQGRDDRSGPGPRPWPRISRIASSDARVLVPGSPVRRAAHLRIVPAVVQDDRRGAGKGASLHRPDRGRRRSAADRPRQ